MGCCVQRYATNTALNTGVRARHLHHGASDGLPCSCDDAADAATFFARWRKGVCV